MHDRSMRFLRLLAIGAPIFTAVGLACTGADPAPFAEVPDDAGTSEVGLDAPPSAPDAGAADAAAAVGFCATKHPNAAYCQDFDSLTDLKSLVVEPSAKATANLTQGEYTSPPRSIVFNIPMDEPSSYAVFKHAVTTLRPVRLELDANFVLLSATEQTLQEFTIYRGNGQVALGHACLNDGDGGVSCRDYVAVCLFKVNDGGTPVTCTSHDFTAPLKSSTGWAHLALEVQFAADGYFKLEQDGTTLLDVQTATYEPGAPPPDADAGTIVTVGVGVPQGRAAINLYVDNVVITVR